MTYGGKRCPFCNKIVVRFSTPKVEFSNVTEVARYYITCNCGFEISHNNKDMLEVAFAYVHKGKEDEHV